MKRIERFHTHSKRLLQVISYLTYLVHEPQHLIHRGCVERGDESVDPDFCIPIDDFSSKTFRGSYRRSMCGYVTERDCGIK